MPTLPAFDLGRAVAQAGFGAALPFVAENTPGLELALGCLV
ncbi:hypothetical protein ACH4CE_08800 [Streptomyces gelaticus]